MDSIFRCAESEIEDVLGYRVFRYSVGICIDQIIDRVNSGDKCHWLACINPHSYVVALKDKRFSMALHEADWLIPDGSGILFASRMLCGGIRRRITGSDIFSHLNAKINSLGGFSVFFLGATPECLADIQLKIGLDFPHIRFAGSFSPPFKPEYSEEELEAMIATINQARPDVLWVGMTAPKQEKWIHQNFHKLDVRFAAAIGAVFEFYTGRVTRSHMLFQNLGLEWLPRLLQQPRRLWRRTFVSAPIFIWHVFKAAIRLRLRRDG